MPTLQTTHTLAPKTDLYYETCGAGRPVVLSHGWPLSGRMWEAQIFALMQEGYQVIAHDRRGFGQSGKTATGYEYNTFASDLNDLMTALDLRDVSLVGFSMGGGEVARYVGLFGTERLKNIVLLGAVTPYLLKTADNPDGGLTQAEVDDMAKQVQEGRIKYLMGLTTKFLNWDDNGAKLGEDFLAFCKNLAYQASPVATVECVHAFSETDFRADLSKFDKPTLVIHGDKDQIVPLEVSGQRVPQYVPHAKLEVIKGAPHGLAATHAEEVNKLILGFI